MRDTGRSTGSEAHTAGRAAPVRRWARHLVTAKRPLVASAVGLVLIAAVVTGLISRHTAIGTQMTRSGSSDSATGAAEHGTSISVHRRPIGDPAGSPTGNVAPGIDRSPVVAGTPRSETVHPWIDGSRAVAGASVTSTPDRATGVPPGAGPARAAAPRAVPGVPRLSHRSAVQSTALTDVPAGWVASTHDLVSGGLDRSYLMVRPPAVKGTSLPVVMMLHGRDLTPYAMERMSHLLPDLGRAIAVYPAGWGRSWNAGGCCGIAHREGVDDVAFLNDVIHQILTTQPDASPHRIYVIGFSNGGRMAMDLACSDPGELAGLAAVEAVPVAPCVQTIPLPVVLVAQTGDPLLTVPTDGPKKVMQGYVEPTEGQTVDLWRSLDGCTSGSTSVKTGAATTIMWDACHGRGKVQYDLYQGGGHRWPEGDAMTPSGQALIASFLWGYRTTTSA